jgi:hypothetical protein
MRRRKTPLKVLGDFLELVDGAAAVPGQRADRLFEAVVEVILDQCPLGLAHRLLDGVELLRDVEAGPAALDHGDHAAYMAFGSSQPLEGVRMGSVPGHGACYPPGGDAVKRNVSAGEDSWLTGADRFQARITAVTIPAELASPESDAS